MSQTPPIKSLKQPPRRRAHNTLPKGEQAKSKVHASVLFALVLFAVAVAALVLVSPKTPTGRAYYSTGTDSGLVQNATGGVNAYYHGLVISELMAANSASVPDENGEYPDWVEIWNSSDHPIELENVGLSDASDSIRFLFPNVTLAPDERLIVYCSDVNQAVAGKSLHARFKLSSTGETVYLFDPNAYLIDKVTYRILGADSSWVLLPDGGYGETTAFSPGYPNTEEGHLAYRTATMVTDGAIIINEIMPDPISGLTDEDGDFSDWIELYNTTDKTVSLDNYALSNKENKPLKWRFPDGASIAPHGYYLVYCSGKDRRDSASAVPHANFKISAEHDTVVLSDNRGRLVDRVVIDNIPEDYSYARNDSGVFYVCATPTPTLSNTRDSAWLMDRYLRQWNRTGVYISEVMASNDTTIVQGSGLMCDWIELYNSSGSAVDLSGYGLSDNPGRPRKWQFPQGTVIEPGSYKIIFCDGDTAASTASQPHTNFRISRLGCEVICLSDPTGRILDKLMLPEMRTDISYGRSQNLTGFFYYAAPTPLSENGMGFRGYAAMPELTLKPGLYTYTGGTLYTADKEQAVQVSLSVPEGTRVYYTTDGSIPTESDSRYAGGALDVTKTTVLRARAFSDDPDVQPGTVVTGTYFVNVYHTLPMVSLVCDPDELWNPETGMLTIGENAIMDQIPFKNTVYREYGKIGREGNIEFYLTDGTTVLSQGVEMSLQGQFSLDIAQKTFKLRAKAAYGSKYFNAKLFDDREFTFYKSLVLRTSGNDGYFTRLRDGFQSRLLDAYGATVLHQAWNPVVVYLNGVYWGHYNMRERVDQYFVAQHEGVPMERAKTITILEGSGKLKSGSEEVRKEYKNMITRIKRSDPAHKQEDLQYILDNVDVDNYLEYMALVMFVGDSDIGNIRFYRTSEEGAKWRWIFYDKDYGLYRAAFNSPYSYTKSVGMGEQKIDNTIFLKLLEVPEYKDRFLRKLGDVFNTFTTDYMLSILEPMIEQIKPEMSMHFGRWAEEYNQKIIAELPRTQDGAARYWEKMLGNIRNTCKKRPTLLWEMIRDEFKLTNAQMLEYFGEKPPMPEDAIL